MFIVKFMKKMLRQTLSVFEPEQCLEMGNYKYSYDRNFVILWQMTWCVFLFFLYILFILSFDCVTIVNRDMKSVSAL